MIGKFVWFDVAAGKASEVAEFYARLFDWPTGPAPAGYETWFMDGEQPWAGVVHAEDASTGRWVPYVQVDDLDAARDRAVELGATLLHDKQASPNGTVVTVADPGGAVIMLWVPPAN